jgi:cyclase
MSKYVRVIPRLDIKGPNLVKGIHLEGLRVLGKPDHYARHYYESFADELIYMDVVASLYNRNSLHDMIVKTSREIFIPLTVGGGLRTLDDIKNVLRAGADKVALNTAAIHNPDIIRQASRRFGSSTIVVSIEVMKKSDGRYLAYTDNGREHTGVEVLPWARRVEELGAGEILLTSIDREGTGEGFDVELTRLVSESVSIPVIACGGPGTLDHVVEAVNAGKADAVAVASMLHYHYLTHNEVEHNVDMEGNVAFLKSDSLFTKVEFTDIAGLKSHMTRNGISCRRKDRSSTQ